MQTTRFVLAALGSVFLLGATATKPALADYDGWRRHEWREHEWREREWRRHEWREHHAWRPAYEAPPPVYYAPAPTYYAPPPAYYAPPVVTFGFGYR